jgi:hypothetical protein
MHMLLGRPLSRYMEGRRKLVILDISRYKSKEKVHCICLKLNSYIQSKKEF